MAANIYDLVVIGSGPGGEVGAIRAAQLGLKVALVEKFSHLGGTCLNVGCIPTKALLASAKLWDKLQHVEEMGFAIGKPSFDWAKILARKDKIVDQQRKGLLFLMKKNKIDVFSGHGRLEGVTTVTVTAADATVQRLTTKHVLLATGSRVRELPIAPTNGKNILSSDHILFIDHVPASLAIIGGGVVGMEFASLFGRMGTAVTVFEATAQVLPFEDEEVVQEFVRAVKKQGVTIATSTKISKVEDLGNHCQISVEGQAPQQFAKVLVSIGREPVSQNLGLETVKMSAEKSGHIKVDADGRTVVPTIFAIGDLIATPALAHTASAEAMHAVEVIAGHKPPAINYSSNPSAIYCYPEVASIGPTEAQLKKAGTAYKVAKFPFAPLAKAKIEDMTVGFIKILYEPKYKELLAVHIIGAMATEMISNFSLGKVLETTLDEIGHTIFPHPTMSETIMEAAHVGMGGAIHL